MTKPRKKLSQVRVICLTIFGLACLAILIKVLLADNDLALLNPKGPIAQEQSNLMVFSVSVMLVLAIPTLLVFYFFAWKYRESNHKVTYDSTHNPGKLLTLMLWAIPSILVFVLVQAMWPAAHRLDPHKQIASNVEPITIQVVAMRWKWLFIYPEQHIASVNFVQVPVDTPIKFNLTADEAPMSSFWVPHWGGQLYAMTGHNNQLNLMADTPGDFRGSSAEINGAGFAGMKFTARASSMRDFDQWVQTIQNYPNILSRTVYEKLLLPSENKLVAFYSLPDPSLYDRVLTKYADSHSGHMEHE